MKKLLLYLFLAASVMAQATRVVDTNNLPSWPVGSTNIPISVDSYGRVVSTGGGGGGGTGTVTSVSVTTANGVSGTVATATTTPAITLTLGAITPTTVVASTSLKGPFFVSAAADPADAGAVRLGNAELIEWESSPTGSDITLTVNSSNLFVFSAAISAPTLTSPLISNLTAGRVTFAGASGLLTDDSDLTFATDTLTATKIVTTTLDTGQGANELYAMDQNVRTTDKPQFANVRNTVSVLTYNASTMAIDFSGDGIKTVTVTGSGNCTFTTSNLAAGRIITLVIINGSATTNFTLPAWLFLGAAAPASLAANKTAAFTLISTSTTDGSVLAEYGAQP